MFKRLSLRTILLLALLVVGMHEASAAPPMLITNFKFHGFDKLIQAALNYDSATVVYFREFGSITQDQLNKRLQYESIGCHPFNVMKSGKFDESGFDCRSFFCVGYEHGQKVCRDTYGKAVGGVVEINRRLGLINVSERMKSFEEFPDSDRSADMKRKIIDMEAIKCKPFYLMSFDVAVGEGYTCEELGQFPYYSGANTCSDNWTDTEGLVCTSPEREGEIVLRQKIMKDIYGIEPSSSSSESSIPSSSSSSQEQLFSDVIVGKYGYTAITDLALKGIIKGYSDGTFKPANRVNRAEFTKLLIAGTWDRSATDTASCFPDVPADQWFTPFVCMAKNLGWLKGYEDGHFRPERNITKAEGLKVVVASLGVPLESTVPLPPGVPATAWYAPYVRKAVEIGVLLETSFDGTQDATRADAAVWIYRARKVKSQQE